MTGNLDLRKVGLMICLSCFVLGGLHAQSRRLNCKGFRDSILHKFVYTQADVMPEPEGGMEKLNKCIIKSIYHTKKSTASDVPFGKLIIAFVVEINGTVDGVRIVNSSIKYADVFSGDINQLKWKPAYCGNKIVPFLKKISLYIEPSMNGD